MYFRHVFMTIVIGDSSRLGGLAQSDRCEDVINSLVELVSWTSSVDNELSCLRPVGGDLQSVRRQLDAIQVKSLLLCLLCRLWFHDDDDDDWTFHIMIAP